MPASLPAATALAMLALMITTNLAYAEVPEPEPRPLNDTGQTLCYNNAAGPAQCPLTAS